MTKYILSIFTLCVTLFMTTTDTVAQKKTKNEVTIEDRLSTHLPMFAEPNCVKYLIEFGSNDKAVKSAANSIDINYFSKLPIEQVEGAYMLLYADPDNITTKAGMQVTNTVLYIFSFMPDGQYFSFSSNMTFKTVKQAKEAYSYLTTLIGVSEDETEQSVSNLVSCTDKKSPLRGDNRMVTVRRDGLSVTFIVMDYDILQQYTESLGS